MTTLTSRGYRSEDSETMGRRMQQRLIFVRYLGCPVSGKAGWRTLAVVSERVSVKVTKREVSWSNSYLHRPP